MNRAQFWLTEAQFARIEPHLPTDRRGKPRVDDRRVISGIVQDDPKAADETAFYPIPTPKLLEHAGGRMSS